MQGARLFALKPHIHWCMALQASAAIIPRLSVQRGAGGSKPATWNGRPPLAPRASLLPLDPGAYAAAMSAAAAAAQLPPHEASAAAAMLLAADPSFVSSFSGGHSAGAGGSVHGSSVAVGRGGRRSSAWVTGSTGPHVALPMDPVLSAHGIGRPHARTEHHGHMQRAGRQAGGSMLPQAGRVSPSGAQASTQGHRHKRHSWAGGVIGAAGQPAMQQQQHAVFVQQPGLPPALTPAQQPAKEAPKQLLAAALEAGADLSSLAAALGGGGWVSPWLAAQKQQEHQVHGFTKARGSSSLTPAGSSWVAQGGGAPGDLLLAAGPLLPHIAAHTPGGASGAQLASVAAPVGAVHQTAWSGSGAGVGAERPSGWFSAAQSPGIGLAAAGGGGAASGQAGASGGCDANGQPCAHPVGALQPLSNAIPLVPSPRARPRPQVPACESTAGEAPAAGQEQGPRGDGSTAAAAALHHTPPPPIPLLVSSATNVNVEHVGGAAGAAGVSITAASPPLSPARSPKLSLASKIAGPSAGAAAPLGPVSPAPPSPPQPAAQALPQGRGSPPRRTSLPSPTPESPPTTLAVAQQQAQPPRLQLPPVKQPPASEPRFSRHSYSGEKVGSLTSATQHPPQPRRVSVSLPPAAAQGATAAGHGGQAAHRNGHTVGDHHQGGVRVTKSAGPATHAHDAAGRLQASGTGGMQSLSAGGGPASGQAAWGPHSSPATSAPEGMLPTRSAAPLRITAATAAASPQQAVPSLQRRTSAAERSGRSDSGAAGLSGGSHGSAAAARSSAAAGGVAAVAGDAASGDAAAASWRRARVSEARAQLRARQARDTSDAMTAATTALQGVAGRLSALFQHGRGS